MLITLAQSIEIIKCRQNESIITGTTPRIRTHHPRQVRQPLGSGLAERDCTGLAEVEGDTGLAEGDRLDDGLAEVELEDNGHRPLEDNWLAEDTGGLADGWLAEVELAEAVDTGLMELEDTEVQLSAVEGTGLARTLLPSPDFFCRDRDHHFLKEKHEHD